MTFRLSILAASCVALLLPLPGLATAQVCDPSRSTWDLSESPVECQYRFNRTGTLDELTITVVLLDAFDSAVPCSTRVRVVGASPVACEVDPGQLVTNVLTGTGWSTEAGEAVFVLDRLGGRGEITLELQATDCCHEDWGSWITLGVETVSFSTPDLNGSCGPVVTIEDLGLWAAGLPPGYQQTSDFGCDGTVGVLDLAVWATGL